MNDKAMPLGDKLLSVVMTLDVNDLKKLGTVLMIPCCFHTISNMVQLGRNGRSRF